MFFFFFFFFDPRISAVLLLCLNVSAHLAYSDSLSFSPILFFLLVSQTTSLFVEMEKCQHRENGEKKALEIRKPPQFTLISSFTPFYTTILLAPLVITVFFFFDFSKPKLYLTEPLSCFFFFPTHIYIHVVIHHALYPFRQVFFPLFSLFFFFISFSCTCI